MRGDRALARFVKDRQQEIEEVVTNRAVFLAAIDRAKLTEDTVYAGKAEGVL